MILNLKLICPRCGSQFAMKDATDINVVHDVAKLATRFGWDGWPCVELYLRSFQTAPDRPLKPEKLRLLLEEVVDFWANEGFVFNGQRRQISRTILLAVMRHVGLMEKTGFKNHNYLKKVAIEFQHQANRRQEMDEREREKQLRERPDREGGLGHVRGIISGLEGGADE